MIANAMTATPLEVGVWLGCAGAVLWIYNQLMQAVGKRSVPQPLAVTEDSGVVDRKSYHTHCKINRDEHKRIEDKFADEIRSLGNDHNALAREVSSVAKAVELTSARLTQIDHKLDKLLTLARQSHDS